jgi:hypothetical protein
MCAMRFKAWRSNADAGIHLIVHEGGEAFDALPDRIRQLGPWVGSREGDLANLRPHYRALQEQGFAIIYRKPSEFTPAR